MPIPSIICRGKNLHLATMKQFFAALPLRAMPKDEFLDYAEKRMTGFRQTHSQIARQMGLYYCDENNVCHPRFSQAMSLDQILSYSRYWAEHYFVPNPYTPSFPDSCHPTCVYGYVVANCEKYDGELDKILFSIFNQRLNEGDKVKAYLLQFTGIIEDKNGRLVCDKLPTVGTSVTLNRSNELAYFHYYDAWEQGRSVESIEESRKKEFYGWLISKKLTPDYADDLVNSYLVCLSDELKMPPVKTAWHGLREYLYGEKPGTSIYAVADSHELIQYYGEIDRLFAKVADPGPLDATRFNECRAWADSKDNNRAVRAAWIQYKDFMKWRDAQKPPDELPQNVDRLTLALKLFEDKRALPVPGKEKSFDKLLAETREQGAKIDGDYLVGCDYEAFRKTLNDRQVANAFFSKHTEDEKRRLGDFIAGVKNEPKDVSYYLANLPDVSGVGDMMLTAFLTRTRPDLYAFYSNQMFESVKFLGLTNDAALPVLTPDSYNTYKGIQTTIRDRMREMGIKAENGNDADYLTVNEFTWFVSEYQDQIKEEVMKMAMKPADYSTSGSQPQAKKPKVNLAKAEDVVLLRLAAALRAKPFAILAGHSGTGKSRMVRQLAYMTAATGNHKVLFEDADGKPIKSPGNFCMVQVKPNWHDSTDLLGYYSEIKGGFKSTDFVKFICKAYAYPDVPFFVCLDEMNLAPVEQYFAEYLSAIESRKLDEVVILDKDGSEKTVKSIITDKLLADEVWRTSAGVQDFSGLGCEFTQSEHWLKKYGLTIPRNLFVVGTVNMDESTNQFSRKVLDRAFTLEMTDADFEHFGTNNPEPTYADFAGDDFSEALLSGEVVAKKPADDALETEKQAFAAQIQNLTNLKPVLDGTSFVVAYRFANEYMLYADALGKMCEVIEVSGEAQDKKPEAFDDMILMKVLPRITGDTEMVVRIFTGDPGQDKEPRALDDADVGGLAKLLGRESASFGKMKEIVKRGESSGSGTLTFWP